MEAYVKINTPKKTYPYIGLLERILGDRYVIKSVYVLFHKPRCGVCILSGSDGFSIGDYSMDWDEDSFKRINNETVVHLSNS